MNYKDSKQKVFQIFSVLMILTLMALCAGPVMTVQADPGDLGTGPGGVGAVDGSSSLELWLRADKGTYSDNTCSTPQSTSGGVVQCWGDQSGNTANVIKGGSSDPTLITGSQNGQSVIRFGNNRYLSRDVPDVTNQSFTYFAVSVASASMSTGQSLFSSTNADNINDSFQVDVGGDCTNSYRYIYRQGGDYYRCAGTHETNPSIIMVRVSNNASVTTRKNGTLQGADPPSHKLSKPVIQFFKVGVDRTSTIAWPNDIAEEILYYRALNSAERILIQNYLSSKYNVTLGQDDKYNGDTTANGDFDLDVAGIGRESDGSNPAARSVGMVVENASFLQDNGDYLMFGHKTAGSTTGTTTADLPTGTGWGDGNDGRWTRHWYIQVTDVGSNSGQVTIRFDFSDGGWTNTAGNASNYRLLKRSGATGPFSELSATASVSGDTVTFSGVSVGDLGSNFTLGSINTGSSPLGPDAPTAVTMSSMSARQVGSAVRVEWSTALELDVVGFNIYRMASGETPQQINVELIPAKSLGGLFGGDYAFIDADVQFGETYWYWLEVVEIYDIYRFELGPVVVGFPCYLPLVIH
jgi:hypothetical protein